MRAVVQRVSQASVTVNGTMIAGISNGLLVLLAIRKGDQPVDADWLAEKLVNLRIFNDPDGKMNISLRETGGHMLVVSQFTLFGDCRKGRRPSFIAAADPPEAVPLYDYFIDRVMTMNVVVHAGQFGAMMNVHLTNDGPVTLILDTPSR